MPVILTDIDTPYITADNHRLLVRRKSYTAVAAAGQVPILL